MRLTAHAQRGQTLPFWTIAIGATLTLLFFVANYSSTVRWQIRAQNAADSAASAGIATDANMYNQASTIEFAAAVGETRMRYLIQAIVNTIDNPAACGNACDAYYAQLVNAYNAAASNYSTLAQTLKKGDNLTEGGLKNSVDKAIGLVSSDCVTFDCAFTYTSTVDGSTETVDVVSCKKVSFLGPGLTTGAGAAFTALGRSVATLSPISEAFVPGAADPSTGTPYQPDESPGGSNAPSDYIVTFKHLTVNLTWYVAGTTRPASPASGYGCS